MVSLRHLARPALVDLAVALEAGRLAPPYSATAVARYVPRDARDSTTSALNELNTGGLAPTQLAMALRLLADERTASQEAGDRADLVLTVPDARSPQSRSTAGVVKEMFGSANRSVIVASYALDTPRNLPALFQPLADRMAAVPDLDVRLYVNVIRRRKDETPDAILIRKFVDTFRKGWPADRLPEVFHDPRSLAQGTQERACLHAKSVIVDDEHVLVTSANFTEAAHQRNIEAGVVLHDKGIAVALRQQFDALVQSGDLVRIPGLA